MFNREFRWGLIGQRLHALVEGVGVVVAVGGVLVLLLAWLLYRNVWVVFRGEIPLPDGVAAQPVMLDVRLLQELHAERQGRLQASPSFDGNVRRVLP